MTIYHGHDEYGWARIARTTLADHITEVEDLSMRNHKFLALLQAKGQIKYKCSGNGFDWPLKIRNNNVAGFDGTQQIVYDRKNLNEVAKQSWRGYIATESLTEREFLMNSGSETQIYDVFGTMIENLEDSMKQQLPLECFVDGDLPGNETSWHGLESMFGYDGTVNVTDGTQRTANAADLVAYPLDTYAGLSTELGSFGGEQYTAPNGQLSVWPNYLASPEYDCWSPLIVNYTSTNLPGTAHTWVGQGKAALSYAITQAQKNSTLEEAATQFYMARDLWNDFLESLRTQERIQVSSSVGLRALGFRDVVEWDGVECTWDNAVPPKEGYLVPLGKVEIRCMYETLMHPEGPVWDMDNTMWKGFIKTLSNLKYKSPRNFAKLAPIAA